MSFYSVIEQYRDFDFEGYFAGVTEEMFRKSMHHAEEERCTGFDLLNFLSPRGDEHLEEMAVLAQKLTRHYFGRVVSLYQPIYLANYCCNGCVYCGFSSLNKIKRRQLTLDEIEKEAAEISKSQVRHILMLTGEAPGKSDFAYLKEAAAILKKYFDSVSEAEAAIQYEKLNEQEAKALTRSDTGIIGRTQMWDNIDGMGDDIIIYAGMYQFAQVPNLGASPYYFNDKVTSLNVYYTGEDNTYCTVLHAYENTQYSGNVLICIGKQWDHHVHRNLSWYACGNGTWDNKISSLTLEIAKVGDYEMNH